MSIEAEDRPQYCICNKHTWLTAISKRATFECPACKAEELEAQVEAVRNCQRYTHHHGGYTTDNPTGKWMLSEDVLAALEDE